jgi:hypothetical protein
MELKLDDLGELLADINAFSGLKREALNSENDEMKDKESNLGISAAL